MSTERTEPAAVVREREMLLGWLDYHRATLARKCAGLNSDQLAERSVPPSSLSLLGIVRHLTDVERAWLRRQFEDEEIDLLYGGGDEAFDGADPAVAEASMLAWVAECVASREVLDRHSLDELALRPYKGGPLGLRWIVTHLIEEYARHNGHADLLRERIDGVTGK